MTTAAAERVASLDQEHFDAAAQFAASQLAECGVAMVRLAPGDMTEYRIAIVAPGVEWAYGEPRQGRYYWVTLCAGFGAGYEWAGGEVHDQYAAEKWTNEGTSKGTRAHTGAVMARFLSGVAAALHSEATS